MHGFLLFIVLYAANIQSIYNFWGNYKFINKARAPRAGIRSFGFIEDPTAGAAAVQKTPSPLLRSNSAPIQIIIRPNISKSIYGHDMRPNITENTQLQYAESYGELFYKKSFLEFLQTPVSRILINRDDESPRRFSFFNIYNSKIEELYWDTIFPKKYTNSGAGEIFAREFEEFMREEPWE